MALRVIRLGHPVLRKQTEPVNVREVGSSANRRLIKDLRETLRAEGGIGIAAPQAIPFTVMYNPRLEFLMKHETIKMWESCLSVPSFVGKVERFNNVVVSYYDEEGQPKRMACTGYLSGVIQHETDHLIGKLFVDRMRDMRDLAYTQEWEDWMAKDMGICDNGSVHFLEGHG